jgi:hypothetical protein
MRIHPFHLALPLLLLGCAAPDDAPSKIDPGFRSAQLASNRAAIWPIQNLDMDLDTREVIRVESGSTDAFLKSFALKLSGRLLPVFQAPSLDSHSLTEALSNGNPSTWLNAPALIKSLKTPAKEGAAKENPTSELIRLPALKGIKYGVLCQSFKIERPKPELSGTSEMSADRTGRALGFDSPAGFQSTSRPSGSPNASENENAQIRALIRTKATLRFAVVDLETGALVMEETLRVEAGPDRRKGFYEVQEQLVDRILARISKR